MTGVVVHRYGPVDAPDVVLLHGLTEAGTAWPDAVARWGASWRMHAPDQRGHGTSPRVATEDLDRLLDVLVDDLLTLLDDLPAPAAVVGHSLGGRVAVVAALRRSERFACLVLEEPALDAGPIGYDRVDADRFAEEQERFLATFDDGAAAAEIVRMRSATTWTEAEIIEWAACKRLVDRRMIAHLSLGAVRRTASLDALQVPTLVIAAAGGPLAPDPAQVTNPFVRVELLDGVGHCVRRDAPDRFHAIVDPFLNAHRPQGRRPGAATGGPGSRASSRRRRRA